MKQLPKELFIWNENEGQGDEFLATAENAADAAPEPGGIRRVGVYVLKDHVEIASEVTVKPSKRA